MPIIQQHNILNGCQVLVWQIDESIKELEKKLIATPLEWSEFANISHPQKQLEWLSGRTALQTLVQQQDIPYEGTFKDEAGKPHLAHHKGYISITNTSKYVAAVFHKTALVGIDMEKINEKLFRIAHKFLSAAELSFAANQLTLLADYWCAKEAIYKLQGKKKVSFKNHIFIPPFNENHPFFEGQLNFESITDTYQLFKFSIEDFSGVVAV